MENEPKDHPYNKYLFASRSIQAEYDHEAEIPKLISLHERQTTNVKRETRNETYESA